MSDMFEFCLSDEFDLDEKRSMYLSNEYSFEDAMIDAQIIILGVAIIELFQK